MLITAHFHITAHEIIGDPYQRIEPVYAEKKDGNHFHLMIVAADMVSFMLKYTHALRLTKTEREINLRMKKSHNKRYGNAVTFIDIIFIFYGGGNLLLQLYSGKRLISKEYKDS